MGIIFKWQVGEKVRVPIFDELTTTTIIARLFWENRDKKVIEYETDLLTSENIKFTQGELEKYN